MGRRTPRRYGLGQAAAVIACQVAGAAAGRRHVRRARPKPVPDAPRRRPILLSEVVATAGLLFVIAALARTRRLQQVAWAVGAWIGAAYWFTASTSFANPAAAVGRMFSESFAGIAPRNVAGFVLAQLAGAALGAAIHGFFELRSRPPGHPNLIEASGEIEGTPTTK